MDKPKILIFSLAYYPSFVSGAEAAVKEITDRNTDIDFHLITLLFNTKAPREEKIGNVLVHRVGFSGTYISKILFLPLAALKARSLHKKLQFNGLWSVMTYMLVPVVLSKVIGVSAPHILTLQDGDPYDKVFHRWFVRPLVPLIDWGFRHAKIVQVISNYLGTWPEKRGYTGEVVLIRNGANPKNLKSEFDVEAAKNIANELRKQEGDTFLLIVSRLVHQKGVDTIIKALSLLPENIRFVVVGGGPDEKMLHELAQKEGVGERVHFVGPVNREEVANYRNRIVADIFVHPSRSEGLGNSVLSAMAAELPVIATREGGLAEFIFDKGDNEMRQTAWAVEKNNPVQIAEAVSYILTHPEEVAEVTKRARAMVEKEYNWEVIAKEMREKVFSKVI